MRIYTRTTDIIWNYLGTISTIVINVLILPLLIKYLNNFELGLWYTFVSIGGITSLFDFGFSATLARNITYCLSGTTNILEEGKSDINNEVNVELLSKVVGSCKLIYAIIALIAMVLLYGIGIPYLKFILKDNDNIIYFYSWFIYALSIILNLYYYYFSSLLRGAGDLVNYNRSTVIARFLQISFAFILLINGYGILGMAISYFIYSIFFRLISMYIVKTKHPLLKPTNINIRACFEVFKTMWHNAWRDGLVSISNYLSTYALTILCSTYLTLEESGIYSVAFQIVNGVSIFSIVIFNSFQPSMQSSYVSNDKANLVKKYSLSITYYIFSYFIISLLVFLIGIPILRIIRPSYIINKKFLFLMLVNYFFTQYHSLNASFISNTNKIPYLKSYLISSVSIILILILLLNCSSYGLWAIPITQFIIQSCYNNWKWPRESLKMLDISFKRALNYGVKHICGLVINYIKL